MPFPPCVLEDNEDVPAESNSMGAGRRYIRMRSWMNYIFLSRYLLLCPRRASLPVCSAAHKVNRLTFQVDNPLFLLSVIPLPIWSRAAPLSLRAVRPADCSAMNLPEPPGRAERRSDQASQDAEGRRRGRTLNAPRRVCVWPDVLCGTQYL